jgi:hypothetical protein
MGYDSFSTHYAASMTSIYALDHPAASGGGSIFGWG